MTYVLSSVYSMSISISLSYAYCPDRHILSLKHCIILWTCFKESTKHVAPSSSSLPLWEQSHCQLCQPTTHPNVQTKHTFHYLGWSVKLLETMAGQIVALFIISVTIFVFHNIEYSVVQCCSFSSFFARNPSTSVIFWGWIHNLFLSSQMVIMLATKSKTRNIKPQHVGEVSVG